MKRSEIHPTLQEALGTWQAFRKLGFSADDIYVNLDRPSKVVSVCLFAQNKQFVVSVGRVDYNETSFMHAWAEAASAVSEGSLSDYDLEEIYKSSLPYRRSVDFVNALLAKGLVYTKHLN